jgi:transcription-repair coupling factor (superfamily II helicase)
VTDIQKILAATRPMTLAGAPAGFLPWLAADLARAAKGRAVFIAPDEAAMRVIADAAGYFAPELEILAFPAWDCLPYDRASPSLRSSSERLATLHALQRKVEGPQLLVTTVYAATQRTLTPFRIRQLVAHLAPGERIDLHRLTALLSANGYHRTDTVQDAGEYAVRGGIVDLFPAGESEGLRLDFFGDEIESVRRFDPATQRTTGNAPGGFTLLPASETLLDEDSIRRFRSRYREKFGATATGDPLYQAVSEGRRLAGLDHWLPLFEERLVSLFEHLAADDLVVRDAHDAGAADARFEAVADYFENRKRAQSSDPGSYRPLEPETLYLARDEWQQLIEARPLHLVTPFHEPESATVIDFAVDNARDFAPERSQNANIYEAVVDHVATLRRAKKKIVLASYSGGARDRLTGLLADHGLKKVVHADSWQETLGAAADGTVALTVLPLDHGFTTADLALLTEQDMLGDRLVRRRKRRKSADAFLNELATLSPGDLVVHADHGIGRYEGLTQIPVGTSPHDCVALEYAGGDRLYVPVENIDILSRYGSESDGVPLDRLGGEAWQRRKSRMKERIREIAGELIKTAAERALRPGKVIEPDTSYAAFADRFPYEETEDQDRAISDVFADLEAGKPMDRLVCGDVGFGKTEVALRAAFAAAMAGLQVALVCPTTLLARQHYNTFCERFRGFPIEIGRLSRLVPPKEAKETREGLTAGKIDIVIGTHAILAKGVEFRNLGLVIVDEEQRFGVTHKERLKGMRADVHVLTLTATPIPRTLNMAMAGLRDLAIIATPPAHRLAVQTFVVPWDDAQLREAFQRELARGGQVYFLHNDVESIGRMQRELQELVPEARIGVAHGQMPERELERVMLDFHKQRFNVLLCTTIIESGIDIPNANTIIMNRADRFGLAQLHQLRGRVGRSHHRAYAYLVVPDQRTITSDARKRLEAIASMDELGAGFTLATHDLEIRGAGELLGEDQSGQMAEVGFTLYTELLERAVRSIRQGKLPDLDGVESRGAEVELNIPALIPDDYLPDVHTRLTLYKRISSAKDVDALRELQVEMIDRFGLLPDPAKHLFAVAELKLQATALGIRKLDLGPASGRLQFESKPNVDPMTVIQLIQKQPKHYAMEGPDKLRIKLELADATSRLQAARGLLAALRPAA